MVRRLVSILRGRFGPDDAALAQHSTITHARADHAPMLFDDSTDDEAVCLDGFHRMRARLAQAASKALFVELEGLGHNEMIVRVGTDNDPLMPTLLEFHRNRAGPLRPRRKATTHWGARAISRKR